MPCLTRKSRLIVIRIENQEPAGASKERNKSVTAHSIWTFGNIFCLINNMYVYTVHIYNTHDNN